MHTIILKIARLNDWTLVMLTVFLSEILTLTFSSVQSILLWGHVPKHIVFIGAVDAFLVAMPLSYAIIQIVRFSARTHLEKEELETEVGERIRVEEGLQHSIQQLQLVTDNVSDVFWTMDRSGKFKYVSPSVERMLGYTPGEALGMNLSEILRPESLEIALRTIKERLRREETGNADNSEQRYELMHRRKNGSTFWAEVTSSPMRDSEGQLTGFLGVTRNIHDRKLAEEQLKNSEEQLRASLLQKDILLQEVHHRVKNNLAIISALLSLQVRQTGDQRLKELFKETQNRIHAMAFVHEQLYMQDDMETVNFQSYAEGLTYYLQHTYKLGNKDISLSTDIEPLSLSLNTLIPCGLILSELITNSLKYALTDTRGLQISIALHQTGDGLINLIVGDNGPGLPEGLDPLSGQGGLGMNIVNHLVGQLEGDMTIRNNEGTEFSITFPLKKTPARISKLS